MAAERIGIPGRLPFICECADRACMEIIRLSIDEYEEVRADGKHGVRDSVVPWDVVGSGHMRAGIAVPWSAGEFRRVPPCRVRDDVAVLGE